MMLFGCFSVERLACCIFAHSVRGLRRSFHAFVPCVATRMLRSTCQRTLLWCELGWSAPRSAPVVFFVRMRVCSFELVQGRLPPAARSC